MTYRRVLVALVLVASFNALSAITTRAGKAENAYGFSVRSIDESESIALQQFRDRPVLVVNTASFCGFTPQYSGLEKLWRTYRDRGLVVLGVPSNDFGNQEPKSEQEIKDFCTGAFNVTFPLTVKYKVKGPQAHAFYRWVADVTSGRGSPRWNFHKVLIGSDGKVANWFASAVKPESTHITKAIERQLQRNISPAAATN